MAQCYPTKKKCPLFPEGISTLKLLNGIPKSIGPWSAVLDELNQKHDDSGNRNENVEEVWTALIDVV
jgi:hypothetical protein